MAASNMNRLELLTWILRDFSPKQRLKAGTRKKISLRKTDKWMSRLTTDPVHPQKCPWLPVNELIFASRCHPLVHISSQRLSVISYPRCARGNEFLIIYFSGSTTQTKIKPNHKTEKQTRTKEMQPYYKHLLIHATITDKILNIDLTINFCGLSYIPVCLFAENAPQRLVLNSFHCQF